MTQRQPPGQPSRASQEGEFQAARAWVATAYVREAERNPIYERLFRVSEVAWQRTRDCNIDQPFDPTLHPHDFRFWDLVLLISRYFDVRRCGLVHEGPLFPYGWWAICGPRRRGTAARTAVAGAFILRCGVQYATYYAARAVVKGIKLAGGRRLLPKPLQF